MTCQDCKYFLHYAAITYSVKGECRRYPPIKILTCKETGESYAINPPVEGEEWCGEYQPK